MDISGLDGDAQFRCLVVAGDLTSHCEATITCVNVERAGTRKTNCIIQIFKLVNLCCLIDLPWSRNNKLNLFCTELLSKRPVLIGQTASF